MTDTQALVISLAKSLSDSSVINYILYLDNLFTNIPLADALEQLDIEVMRITWINASELSLSLIQLKHAKESLKWEHLKTSIIKQILCFLWQDNNQILDMIIAYNYLV